MQYCSLQWKPKAHSDVCNNWSRLLVCFDFCFLFLCVSHLCVITRPLIPLEIQMLYMFGSVGCFGISAPFQPVYPHLLDLWLWFDVFSFTILSDLLPNTLAAPFQRVHWLDSHLFTSCSNSGKALNISVTAPISSFIIHSIVCHVSLRYWTEDSLIPVAPSAWGQGFIVER